MNFLGLNLIPNASSKEKKEKFYVFLDFDGVLYDIKEVADRTINKKGKSLA